jgi:hypothetical protein
MRDDSAPLQQGKSDAAAREGVERRSSSRRPRLAAKAAWQWWVWNPPLRTPIQNAWTRKLLSPESNALVENCFPIQSHALFIANGHKANASEEHQYPELSLCSSRWNRAWMTQDWPMPSKTGWHAVWSPWQVHSSTPLAATEAPDRWATSLQEVPTYSARPRFAISSKPKLRRICPGCDWCSKELLAFPTLRCKTVSSTTPPVGPKNCVRFAAAAVSDPSTVTAAGTQELVQPLVDQIMRGAQDYDRRQTLAQPVLKLFSRAGGAFPKQPSNNSCCTPSWFPNTSRSPMHRVLQESERAAERAIQPMGQLDADWYIADRMGKMLAANPDLHTDTLLSKFQRV